MLTAVSCFTQPLKSGTYTASEYFLNYPFLLRLYELYLSIKDLEILDEFNLLQNLHLYTQKSVCATSTIPFGEVGGNSPLQLSSRTQFANIEDKKVIAKI